MVENKKILSELKKYNLDLEKHLPEINLDYLKSKDLFASKDMNNEILPLVVSNVMDIKTELGAIRKNLVDSVEGMVLRTIAKEQEIFYSQMDSIFTQLLVEVKGGFASYVSQMSSELSSVKKEIEELKVQINVQNKRIEKNDAMNLELKSILVDLKDDNNVLSKKFETVFMSLFSKINNLGSDFDELKTESKIVEKSVHSFVDNVNSKLSDLNVKSVPQQDLFVDKKHGSLLGKKNVNSVLSFENNSFGVKLQKVNLDVDKRAQKLVSIEERIKKLEMLK